MTEPVQFSQTVRQWMDTFVHRSMRDSARYIKASGFSMPQFFLLMQVYRREHCGISDLSEQLEITNAATSQLVDKLVQADLLIRTEDPLDRRAKQIVLSPKGKEFIVQGIQERYRWMDALEEILTPEEKVKIAEALEIMTRATKEVERIG
jgi:DNA-binding MarR family transcriptional regulator